MVNGFPPQGSNRLDKISCAAYHNANQSIPNNTHTTISLNSELWDTDNMHDTVTNNSRITVNRAGKYMITGVAAIYTNNNGYRQIRILKNGATAVALDARYPPTGAHNYMTTSCIADLDVGDYLEMQLYQNSGGALNCLAVAGVMPLLSVTRVNA